MSAKCSDCASTDAMRFSVALCGKCIDEGKRFCVYCGRTYPSRERLRWCAAGHDHDWCDTCAADWAGECPESDEAQVARTVMR